MDCMSSARRCGSVKVNLLQVCLEHQHHASGQKRRQPSSLFPQQSLMPNRERFQACGAHLPSSKCMARAVTAELTVPPWWARACNRMGIEEASTSSSKHSGYRHFDSKHMSGFYLMTLNTNTLPGELTRAGYQQERGIVFCRGASLWTTQAGGAGVETG